MKYSKHPRLYISSKLASDKNIILDDDQSNYLKNVLRLKNGFKLRVFNEEDGEYLANFHINGKECSIELFEKFRESQKQKHNITVLAPLIKSDKLELICDMATQLGISYLIPIITERVQRRDVNLERLNKIVLEATRQSERFSAPIISDSRRLNDIKFEDFDIILFANEMEQSAKNLKIDIGQKIAVLVGPEGGFTEDEIKFLISKKNIFSVSLGENVLRSETSVVSLLSFVNLT